eukprot:7171526-Prymnesium_polylepis.1
MADLKQHASLDPATAGILVAMQQMRLAVQNLENKVEGMQESLPKAVAAAVPRAVRAYDEEQSAELHKQVVETGLGATLKQIERAR